MVRKKKKINRAQAFESQSKNAKASVLMKLPSLVLDLETSDGNGIFSSIQRRGRSKKNEASPESILMNDEIWKKTWEKSEIIDAKCEGENDIMSLTSATSITLALDENIKKFQREKFNENGLDSSASGAKINQSQSEDEHDIFSLTSANSFTSAINKVTDRLLENTKKQEIPIENLTLNAKESFRKSMNSRKTNEMMNVPKRNSSKKANFRKKKIPTKLPSKPKLVPTRNKNVRTQVESKEDKKKDSKDIRQESEEEEYFSTSSSDLLNSDESYSETENFIIDDDEELSAVILDSSEEEEFLSISRKPKRRGRPRSKETRYRKSQTWRSYTADNIEDNAINNTIKRRNQRQCALTASQKITSLSQQQVDNSDKECDNSLKGSKETEKSFLIRKNSIESDDDFIVNDSDIIEIESSDDDIEESHRDFIVDEINDSRKHKRVRNPINDVKSRKERNIVREEDIEEDEAEFNTCIVCTSKTDAITLDPLPQKHICWISPNGSTKQCFKLETLRRVAKTVRNPTREYLQPPHFRSVMEQGLKEQIIEKFGKHMLNLDEKNIVTSVDIDEDDIEDEAQIQFEDHLESYLFATMGTADLYVCPLCFSEAYRRLYEPASQDEHAFHNFRFRRDPISILSSLDDNMEPALSFSFRKMSQVKAHIKNIHNHDVKGYLSDFYQRFQIRAGDGLLQRFLEYDHNKSEISSRDFYEYWINLGNNSSFMHLLSLVDARDAGRHNADACLKFDSSQLWAELSAPYKEDLDGDELDFIVHDDEVVEAESDDNSHSSQLFTHNVHPEEAMIRELKRRRRGASQENNILLSSQEDNVIQSPLISNSPLRTREPEFVQESVIQFDDDNSDDSIPFDFEPPNSENLFTQVLDSDDETRALTQNTSRKRIIESDDEEDSCGPLYLNAIIGEKCSQVNRELDLFLNNEVAHCEEGEAIYTKIKIRQVNRKLFNFLRIEFEKFNELDMK